MGYDGPVQKPSRFLEKIAIFARSPLKFARYSFTLT